MFVGEGAGGGIEDILCLRDFLSNISELELKGDGERERGGGVEADCATDTDWPPWVANTSQGVVNRVDLSWAQVAGRVSNLQASFFIV